MRRTARAAGRLSTGEQARRLSPGCDSPCLVPCRALYAANLAAARLLLAREDLDTTLKDHEGLSPYDVYNSTIEGTNPHFAPDSVPAQLFTWGTNRNFVLGLPGDADRTYPDRVSLSHASANAASHKSGWRAWQPVSVRDVRMARLHSAIVTAEPMSNVQLCGFGTRGRGGSSTQFRFRAMDDFHHSVASLAVSADHTVIVTTAGDVYTFGLNRFSQLGYTLDPSLTGIPATDSASSASASKPDPVQYTPRKVVGALKKAVVLGAAASRTHTAVFTDDALYTWGTNRGQLGYSVGASSTSTAAGTATPPALGAESSAQVQVQPRKVTSIPDGRLKMVSATDSATVCLFESGEVVVLTQDVYIRVTFPLARFPATMQTYRPPQVSTRPRSRTFDRAANDRVSQESTKPTIIKIDAVGSTCAALSFHGDVFTFSLTPGAAEKSMRPVIKPQRIWSLRRKFTAVTDVAVGLDGAVILSTVSGHVFVRTKRYEAYTAPSSSKSLSAPTQPRGESWKFSKVPGLQRVVKVASNSTGSFAAIRSDVPLKPIEIERRSLADDLMMLMPQWRRLGAAAVEFLATHTTRRWGASDSDDEEDNYDMAVDRDVAVARLLHEAVERWDETGALDGDAAHAIEAGCSLTVIAAHIRIPAHHVILRARLGDRLLAMDDSELHLPGASDFAAMLFLHYVYTDELVPVWNPRVTALVRERHPDMRKLQIGSVKVELQVLANTFGLGALSQRLASHSKHSAGSTLVKDLSVLSPLVTPTPPDCDIVLELQDREVRCHSAVLRARCPFFETFYSSADWTSERTSVKDPLRFDLEHLSWSVMEPVMRFLYHDSTAEELFGHLGTYEVKHPDARH